MAALKVLISGGGVAAGCFANCLLRAYPDANITIVERAAALRHTGAAVDVRNAAVDIVQWLGVEPEIRANGTNEAGLQFVDAKDKPIVTFAATGRTDLQSFTSEYEVMRGTLAKIFMDPVLDKVNLLLDETVDTYEPAADGSGRITVTLSNSKKTDTYDLLVAADGLRSKIRGQLLGPHPDKYIYDEGCHVCYFTTPKDMLNGSKMAKAYSTTAGRCLVLRPDPNPAGRSSCLLLNVTWKSQVKEKKRFNDAIRQGNDAYKALMREKFQDAGWIAPELLDMMDKSGEDFYCSLFAQTRVPNLQKGNRVVLLGDAGHAVAGMGTSCAIIGSCVLAGELLRHPHDIDTALKNYEDIMLPFVREHHHNIQFFQAFMPQSSWAVSIRNVLLRIVGWTRLDKLAMSATESLGWAEKKVVLPDYEWPSQT